MSNLRFIDYIGIAGACLILFAFFRITIGKWRSNSLWYELDNLLGAAFMVIYAFSKHAYVSIVLNVVWLTVAFIGVSSFAERRMERAMRHGAKKKRTRTRR